MNSWHKQWSVNLSLDRASRLLGAVPQHLLQLLHHVPKRLLACPRALQGMGAGHHFHQLPGNALSQHLVKKILNNFQCLSLPLNLVIFGFGFSGVF